MKFRYYITDNYDGCVKGTDDLRTAEILAQNEDLFVVDSETGMWLPSDNTRKEVREYVLS